MGLQVAQFLSCQCGVVGTILLSNGESYGPLLSKEDARQSINDLLRNELIDQFEARTLFSQVMESNLPRLEAEVDYEDAKVHVFSLDALHHSPLPEVN